MTERGDELIGAVGPERRGFLKRVLKGGAAIWAAPVVATFALDQAGAKKPKRVHGGNQTHGPNQTYGSNQTKPTYGSNQTKPPDGSNQTEWPPHGSNQTEWPPHGSNQTEFPPHGSNQTYGGHRKRGGGKGGGKGGGYPRRGRTGRSNR